MHPPPGESPLTAGSQLPGLIPPGPEGFQAVGPPGVPVRPRPSAARRAPSNAINAVLLLKALRRRWLLALVLGCGAGVVAAAVVWKYLPSAKFTATTILHVDSVPQNIIFKTSEQHVDFGTYQNTQTSLIKSRKVLNMAARDPRVSRTKTLREQADPIAWLENSLQVSYTGEVLRITLSGDSPQDLGVLVDAVTDTYLREVVEVEYQKRRERYDRLQDLNRSYQAKLLEKRKELRKLVDQVGSNDQGTVRYSHELALERRSLAERELMKIRYELRTAHAELKARQSIEAGPVADDVVPEEEVRRRLELDPVVSRSADQMAQAQARYHETAAKVRNPNDPAVQHYAKLYASAKATLEARTAAIRPVVIDQARAQSVNGADGGVVALKKQIAVLEELERLAKSDVDGLSDETTTINRGAMNLEEVQDQITHIDAAAKRIGTEVESLNVELETPPRVTRLEKAETPRRQSDKRLTTAAVAGLGAFAVALLGVGFLEYRAQRVGSSDEVLSELRLRLVGSLPAMPAPSRWQPKALEHRQSLWHDLLVESIDAIRAMLLHTSSTQAIQSVMITSAVGGEGKTSLACHLAISLARAGRLTLLVDCDMRRPSVHRVLGLPEGPGLSEVLRGEVSLDEAVRRGDNGLWVLTAGKADARSIQALAHEETHALFKAWKEQYAFVVVDTAPILPVADALFIGQQVDAAICSVMRDVSRVPRVFMANERLLSMGVRILGAVMVGERWGGHSSRYGYGSTYGYRGLSSGVANDGREGPA